VIEAAKAATDQADWNAVVAFELDREARLFDMEQQVAVARDGLVEARRAANARLEFAVVLGFALQQIGFVIVLLAGLLHQHGRSATAPAQPDSG